MKWNIFYITKPKKFWISIDDFAADKRYVDTQFALTLKPGSFKIKKQHFTDYKKSNAILTVSKTDDTEVLVYPNQNHLIQKKY